MWHDLQATIVACAVMVCVVVVQQVILARRSMDLGLCEAAHTARPCEVCNRLLVDMHNTLFEG